MRIMPTFTSYIVLYGQLIVSRVQKKLYGTVTRIWQVYKVGNNILVYYELN